MTPDMPAVLTISIPTFERRDTVIRTVQQFRSVCDGLPVRVLVADNASKDGTVEALEREAFDQTSATPLDVVRGSDNQGLVGNFLRLVESCTTSHLLLISDEEGPSDRRVYADLIERLRLQPQTVMVASPSRTGGRSIDRPIDPEELWDATKYLSGIVYPVDELRVSVAMIRQVTEIEDITAIWNLWPFYLVVVEMLLQDHGCRWSPEDLFVRREQLPTRVEDERFPPVGQAQLAAVPSGDAMRARYKSLDARLAQYSALMTYLRARSTLEPAVARVDLHRRFVADLEGKLFPAVSKRIAAEHPLLTDAFQRGARRSYGPSAYLRDPFLGLRGRGFMRRLRRPR